MDRVLVTVPPLALRCTRGARFFMADVTSYAGADARTFAASHARGVIRAVCRRILRYRGGTRRASLGNPKSHFKGKHQIY